MSGSPRVEWKDLKTLDPTSYTCGHCSETVASERGYHAMYCGRFWSSIYICPVCNEPTYFGPHGERVPGSASGHPVQHIDDPSVEALYEEARRAASAESFTACVLCCRKLLMHIAVSKGAKENQSFTHYADYLSERNYVPPDAKPWVDHVRKKGNEANHEISIMQQDDAEELLSFVEMLLRIIYEFPEVARRRYPKDRDGAKQ